MLLQDLAEADAVREGVAAVQVRARLARGRSMTLGAASMHARTHA